jgi:predicted ATP-grasp superfamily ATP-dependent carboligase
MTELTSLLLLEHPSSLHGATLPFPAIATVDSLADKCQLMQTAAELDIPTPETLFSGSRDSLNCDLNALPYPVVIKPGKSWLKIQDTWCRSSVRFAGNRLEAQTILDTDPALENGAFMIQEHVPGHGKGVFCLYDNGSPLAFFAHHRLREKPPRGGVSVLSQSVPVDQALGSYARLLLDHAGWHGVAMVEFKVTPDGRPFLMEINTRFWGSLQLAIDAGVDFPWLLYRIASGEKVEPVESYRTGIRLRWLLGDLDHLYLVLRDPGFSVVEKTKAVAAFLTPSPFKTRHEVNRWNDMGPFWWELKQYVRELNR